MRSPITTPTLIQMEVTECGAVSLGIILRYYGSFVPVAELRTTCGVSRDGCCAFNLIEAAKRYGLDAEGYELTSDELHEISAPSILFWDRSHFVVLEGIKGQTAYINDPAKGRHSLPLEEFDQHFSGVALELKPTSDFQKRGQAVSLWQQVHGRIRGVRRIIGFLFISQLILLVVGLGQPVFSRIFLDNILGRQQFDWSVPLALSILFAGSLIASGGWLQGYVRNRLRAKLSLLFASRFLWHTIRLPLLFFFQRFGGEIISRIQLNTRVTQSLTGEVSVTLINVLLILFYGIIMFQYDVPISLIGIATAGLNISSILLMNELRKSAYAHVQQEQARYTGMSIDAIKNIENVKICGCEPFFLKRMLGLQSQVINALQTIGARDTYLIAANGLLQSAAQMLLLAVGCHRVMYGSLTIGMFIAFQMLMSSFLSPFKQLMGLGMQLQTLRLDLARLDDVLENPIDPHFLQDGERESKDFGEPALELRHISFSYSPVSDPVIQDFSLSIRSGSHVALVGNSGAGKSTISQIITGLFPVQKGELFYGGQPASSYSREEFPTIIASVSQNLFLVEGTVWDNLTLWNPHITEDALWKALYDACIDEEVRLRDGGLSSRVIEGGHNFSQGQRQRLEIARALAMEPKILILDEATSALDSETEAQVIQRITQRQCACLIITHRLSTIQQCEKILVLDRGRIHEEGSHEELMKNKQLYYQLYTAESFR